MKPWTPLAIVAALALAACGDHPEKRPAPAAAGASAPSAPKSEKPAPESPRPRPKPKGHVVGKVGDRLFTDREIDAEFDRMPPNFRRLKHNPAMRANILNNLMTRYALTEKAHRMGIDNDPAVKARIEQARSSILLQELNKRQRAKLAPTDPAELKRYYQAHIARFSRPEMVHVRHILVKDERLAKRLLKRLKKGADFAELARKYSEDKGSKARGGEIGSFPRGRMDPAFEKAAFSLTKDGELTGPVKTRFGYHIIQRLGHTDPGKRPFDEVKPQIENELKQQRFREWVEKVKREMGLRVVDPRYQRHRRPIAPPSGRSGNPSAHH